MIPPQPHEPLGDEHEPDESCDALRKPQRWGFGAFLLVQGTLLASAAFVSVLLGADTVGKSIPVRDVLIGTMAPTMIAAALALLIPRLRGNGPIIDLRISWRWDDVRTGLRCGLLGLVLTTVGAFVWTRIVGSENATSAIAALVQDKSMSIPAAASMFAYLWLLGPICEELIYRGILWRAVERLPWGRDRWGRLAAFLISTAVFAVSHLEPLRTTLLLVIAIPIGLARLVTGRLLASIVAHQVNNFLPAVVILLTGLGVLQA